MRQALLAASIILLTSCGGGGSDSPPPPPQASTASFAVRAALDTMLADGVNLNLAGSDNVSPGVSYSGAYRAWTGTFSMSQRTATVANTPASCAGAVVFVDARVTLTRTRDGFMLQEGASFGYAADYRPLCALLLDGHYWAWNLSEGLPAASTVKGNLSGVQFTGVASRTVEPLDIDSNLTSLVGLDPDTTSSAYLSFVYRVIPLGTGTLPFQMFGEDTEFRFKIAPSGQLLGFQYVRSGNLPDTQNGAGFITLKMNSL